MTTLDLPLEINLEAVHFTDEQFYQLCIHNPEMAIEQNAQGVLIVMPPVGGESGNQEMEVGGELYLWNKQTQLGKVFSSSTVFQLPIGSKRWSKTGPKGHRPMPPG